MPSIINRVTTALRAFIRPEETVFWQRAETPKPFRDELPTETWVPPLYTGPLDLDDDGRETTEIRKAYREYHRREPSARTAIEGKVAAIAALDVAVQAGDEHDETSNRAAEFVDWTVSKTSHGWDGLVNKILRPALIDGWSANEKIFDTTEYHSKWGGIWGLKYCKQKDTAKLSLQLDRYRNVKGIVSHVRGLQIHDPGKVILFSHADLWENPFGQSDLRAAYRACYLIEEAYKLWNIALKLYGGPFLMGKYKTTDTKVALERAMQAARAAGWMSMPKDDEIDVLNLATATSFDAFERKINKTREEVFMTIRGSYLPFLEGSGSDNRGDTKIGKMASNDIEFLLAKAVGRCISHQLIPDLVYPNFGRQVSLPIVTLGGVNWNETKAQLEVAEMVLTKFRKPVSGKWIYTVSQIPSPTSDEDAVQPPADPSQQSGPSAVAGGLGLLTGSEGTESDSGSDDLFGGLGAKLPKNSPSPVAGGPSSGMGGQTNDADRVPFAAGYNSESNVGEPADLARSAPLHDLPISLIRVDPDRFQWRPLHDPINGVVRDRRIAAFDVTKAKPLTVWIDPANRNAYLVDGHHTLDTAKRAGYRSAPCQFIEAKTAEEAARKGMLQNLGVAQFSAPGSPPREGLVWKEETHRWIRPDDGKKDEPANNTSGGERGGERGVKDSSSPSHAVPANSPSSTEQKSSRLRKFKDAALNTKVARTLFAGEHLLAAAAHKTRDIAITAAKKRGLDDDQTDRLRRALVVGDLLGGWVTGGVTAAVAGPLAGKAVSLTMPSVSAFYLAYSLAKNPVATWHAAREVVASSSLSPKAAGKMLADAWAGRETHSRFANLLESPIDRVADLMSLSTGEIGEFHLAVFLAALQQGYSVDDAVTVAAQAGYPRSGAFDEPPAGEENLGLEREDDRQQFGDFREADHPRDDRGQFVSKADIAAAKSDPAKRQELEQRVTKTAERDKLEKQLGARKSTGGKIVNIVSSASVGDSELHPIGRFMLTGSKELTASKNNLLDIQQKTKQSYEDYLDGKITKEEHLDMMAILQAAGEQHAEELRKDLRSAAMQQNQYKQAKRVRGLEAMGTKWNTEEKNERQKAHTFVSDLLHHQLELPDVVYKRPENGRAYCATSFGEKELGVIAVSRKDDAGVYVHELGHHLECTIPGAREACQAFLKKRVGEETPIVMGEKFPHYGRDEKGRKDNWGALFPDDESAAYYVGKVYASGDTEVLSMGLELMYRDPVRFARTDPDYFNLVISILRKEHHDGHHESQRA